MLKATKWEQATLDHLQQFRVRFDVRRFVGVFGSSVAKEHDLHELGVDPAVLDALADGIAQPGYALLNGGYDGTMRLLAQKVTARGGKALGITSQCIDDRCAVECYTEVIVADTHWRRLELLVEAPDLVVLLPGGIGTLTEACALLWAGDRRFTSRKPIVAIGDFWRPILNIIREQSFGFRGNPSSIIDVSTPAEIQRVMSEAFETD